MGKDIRHFFIKMRYFNAKKKKIVPEFATINIRVGR